MPRKRLPGPLWVSTGDGKSKFVLCAPVTSVVPIDAPASRFDNTSRCVCPRVTMRAPRLPHTSNCSTDVLARTDFAVPENTACSV